MTAITNPDPVPYRDPVPTPTDLETVAAAGTDALARFDAALLQAASDEWVKMARLVGDGMLHLRAELPGVGDAYCMHRLRELVSMGRLEVEGDPYAMRFCRLRLP